VINKDVEMNLTPLKAVRAYCVSCSGDNPREVKYCPVEKCPLHPIRSGKNGGKVKSIVKAIRKRCLDCTGGSRKSVELCDTEDCSLMAFRFGNNPAREGIGGKA